MSGLVFKILKPSASFRGVEYNGRKVEKGQAVLLHRSGFGVIDLQGRNPSWQDLRQHLVSHSSGNPRVKLPQFHAILSCKDHSHTPEQLRKVGVDLMDRLGYSGNPMLFYTHHDTRNNHIHIVSSRVGSDGRKIPDRFEAIRSQRILSDLLGRDPGEMFGKAVDKALSYRFSTVAQFMLLMEGQGYRGRRHGEGIGFFRDGAMQGSVPITLLESRAASYRLDDGERKRIRAIISRHAAAFDKALVRKDASRKDGSPKWQSELTRHLHRRYGLEFVFFAGKGHQRPYGYLVIDHGKRSVIKGGEILRLGQLMGEAPIRNQRTPMSGHGRMSEPSEGDFAQGPESIHQGSGIIAMADSLVRHVMEDSGRDARNEEAHTRRRRNRGKRN